jgi:hopanoid biosynthesis associated RND transporter like protein HpnN
MQMTAAVRTVDFSTRYAWLTLAIAIVLTIASIDYAVHHFAINTDINRLISRDLDWRKREIAFSAAFPQYDSVLVVVEAPTAELADEATATLTQHLSNRHDLFRSVSLAGGAAFFRQNALLFQTPEQLQQMMGTLVPAKPLIEVLASDPSLRGLTQSLSFGLMGVQGGHLTLDDLSRPMNAAADTIEQILQGQTASFSWHALLAGEAAKPNELRRFIDVRPVLDFTALEPGHRATEGIRQAAADLKLDSIFQARVRLTGPVFMADEEFATVKEGAVLNGSVTAAIVVVILWLALGWGRIILAVLINLVIGLALTAAAGMMMVGALNLISVYFAVLFVGLGVDFGIQFSVRYRAERHASNDLRESLLLTARRVAAPLLLAACATAAGFMSFLPTHYRGVSELGLIAGVGMLIAFATSMTVLPALLHLLNPPGEPKSLGYPALAPVDRFMERYRIPIVFGTVLVLLAGSPLLYWLRFDFNPLNLRNPKTESVATFLDLRKDPATSANAIEVLTPSLADADALAAKLSALPEVSRTLTLTKFIPDGQDEKLPVILNAAKELGPSLNPEVVRPPTDADNVAALNRLAENLKQAAGNQNGKGATAATRLADAASALANADHHLARKKAEAAFIPPLNTALNELRGFLAAERVTSENLPSELERQWVTPDGRARVEVSPKGDPNDNETLRSFARAVLAVAPNAVAGPISILESGRAVLRAFIEAGIWALLSITVLLWIALRRIGDVLLTLIPLLLAGILTLEICVLIGLPLNFANIIALPLLLGVGVAFKIYYIMAWREGQTNLLQSVLTRAVMFSAATTATAFGSLWLSSHPGTSSMGELLALSLICTLAAAALFQPVLMGKPRQAASSRE